MNELYVVTMLGMPLVKVGLFLQRFALPLQAGYRNISIYLSYTIY